jgi:predicted RNA-binding protein YlxR (DUF448 family)
MKTQPIRTCLGCRKKLPKGRLLKFVLERGNIALDQNGTGHGRSAYCCDTKKCLRIFFGQKKKMSRAFRVQDGQIRAELKDWE